MYLKCSLQVLGIDGLLIVELANFIGLISQPDDEL